MTDTDQETVSPDLSPERIRAVVGQEQARRRLAAAVRSRPPMTLALIGLMLLIHVGTGVWDILYRKSGIYELFLGERSSETLLAWGARIPEAIAAGEPWRMLSCAFLHANTLHIAMNLIAFFGLGRLAEAIYGPIRFLHLFLLCALGGSLLSAVFLDVPSVGASGAVFGLMGACIVFGIRFRSRLPANVRAIFSRGLIPWVVLNLFIGFAIPRVDILGHIGGFVAGGLLALVLRSPVIPGSDEPGASKARALLMAFTSAALLGWALGGMALGLL